MKRLVVELLLILLYLHLLMICLLNNMSFSTFHIPFPVQVPICTLIGVTLGPKDTVMLRFTSRGLDS